MFVPVGNLLKTLSRRSKTGKAMMAIFVRRAFGESMDLVCSDLGDDIIKKVKPATFHHGILTVDCPDLVAAELSMRSGGLIKGVNEILGRRVVYKIRFRNN